MDDLAGPTPTSIVDAADLLASGGAGRDAAGD
jgi:hypothetical protein